MARYQKLGVRYRPNQLAETRVYLTLQYFIPDSLDYFHSEFKYLYLEVKFNVGNGQSEEKV